MSERRVTTELLTPDSRSDHQRDEEERDPGPE
jgi:hypothetical protein